MQHLMKTFLLGLLALFGWANAVAQTLPLKLQARILQLEDERNLNGDELTKLLKHAAPAVRQRAALAIGRIGDQRATTKLIETFNQDQTAEVRAMAAFALGELEDKAAVNSLSSAIDPLSSPPHQRIEPVLVRARVCEALGKILSANKPPPKPELADLSFVRPADWLAKQLPDASAKLNAEERLLASAVITALLRLQVSISVAPLTQLLQSSEPDIRAQAANALSRLRLPINDAVPALIAGLSDNINQDFRANSARALGVSNDPRAVEPLINSLNDKSTEVEIVAIRSLAQLNDARAIEPLIQLFEPFRASTINVMLEAAAALTTLKAKQALPALLKAREAQLPKRWLEFETAAFKLSDGRDSWHIPAKHELCKDRKLASVVAQALAASLPTSGDRLKQAYFELTEKFPHPDKPDCDQRSQPAVMRTRAKLFFDPAHEMFFVANVETLSGVVEKKPLAPKLLLRDLEEWLKTDDLHLRSTLASILADQGKASSLIPLAEALTQSQNDRDNDAKLAILSALAKYKTEPAIAAIKTSLKDRDQLVRRHAVNLLKQLDAGDFSVAIGTVQTGRTAAFYQQVVTASQQKYFATITTAKGTIKLELYPQDAPLTVNNFVTLARKGYFNGLAFHRVVPNFVMQGGDPRGTGDGGPGYAIRCEINQRPYGRGALGMALSGKDTGGSQWFITHAPQPHLDGGYTVFGQVVSGMNVVDRITRDDLMQRVVITNR